MPCPNCGKIMDEYVLDDQAVLHCTYCGGSFFEDNGINRITQETAQMLANDKKTGEVTIKDKLCPKDQTTLVPVASQDNIPPDTTLLRCPACKGVFAYPSDLVIFKKAITAKIDYFKLWGIPLPSVRSIALVSIIIFTVTFSFTTYIYLERQNISRTQAQDLIKNFFVTSSHQYVFISFKSDVAVLSTIFFTKKSTGEKIERIISATPSTYHQIITSEISLEEDITFQIILTDKSGNQTKTEVKRLEINP